MIDNPIAAHTATAESSSAADALPAELLALLSLLASGDPPSVHWPRLAELVSHLLQADFCCVVLRDGADKDRLCVSVYGNTGPLSIAAGRALVRSSSMIRSLLARDGRNGAGRTESPGSSTTPDRDPLDERLALYVPILVDGEIAGVLHARRHGKPPRAFSERQVACGRLAAALIGNSMHLGLVKSLLKSNFAQLALMRSSGEQQAVPHLADPRDMVLRIARSFYRELKNARIEDRHIIAASAEIIGQLSLDLKTRAR